MDVGLKSLRMVTTKKIILASGSPRRKELMEGLGLSFEIRVKDGIDESYPSGLSCEDIPVYIACAKASAYTLKSDELLITADTIVWVDDQVLGKPHSHQEASGMLRLLSGRTHQVITGVCLTTENETRSFACVTDVTFATLSPQEIEYYVCHYRPFDKAGAYGVQEWIGYVGVTELKGSYFNVMGLPVQRLYTELKKMGIVNTQPLV